MIRRYLLDTGIARTFKTIDAACALARTGNATSGTVSA